MCPDLSGTVMAVVDCPNLIQCTPVPVCAAVVPLSELQQCRRPLLVVRVAGYPIEMYAARWGTKARQAQRNSEWLDSHGTCAVKGSLCTCWLGVLAIGPLCVPVEIQPRVLMAQKCRLREPSGHF